MNKTIHKSFGTRKMLNYSMEGAHDFRDLCKYDYVSSCKRKRVFPVANPRHGHLYRDVHARTNNKQIEKYINRCE